MVQQYKPLFKLDSGGMAEVYVAEAVSLAGFKKKVAIKRILPGLLREERFVRMFLDEARLSLHLNHANVVSVFDIGKTDSTYFIVMEYVEGTTIKSLLENHARSGQPLPVPVCIWIVNEILKGLHYAHTLTDSETGRRMGIVHRDISPPNVLLSWNGEVKITDFGLAKATTQLESTDPGVVKGKFSYLSPEAARGELVDHRTDIFAVGILLFEMLTRRRLFLGKSDWQTIENVRAAQIPNIREINSEVPPQLETILHRALALDPNDRFPSAADFAEELVGLLFDLNLRVSARDLSNLLEPIRADRTGHAGPAQPSPGGTHLILDLLNEELTHFQSLDEESESGDRTSSSHDLLNDIGHDEDYDGSTPLDADLGLSIRPQVRPNFAPPENSSPASFTDTTPAPSREDTPLPSGALHVSETSLTPAPDIVPTPESLLPTQQPRRPWLWVFAGIALVGGGVAFYLMYAGVPATLP